MFTNNEFIILASHDTMSKIDIPDAEEDTKKRVHEYIKGRKMNIAGGFTCDEIKIGFKFSDNGVAYEILSLQKVSRKIILVSLQEIKKTNNE